MIARSKFGKNRTRMRWERTEEGGTLRFVGYVRYVRYRRAGDLPTYSEGWLSM